MNIILINDTRNNIFDAYQHFKISPSAQIKPDSEKTLEFSPYKDWKISGWTLFIANSYVRRGCVNSPNLLKAIEKSDKDVVVANIINLYIGLGERATKENIIAINVKPLTKITLAPNGILGCNMGPAGKLPESDFLPIVQKNEGAKPATDYVMVDFRANSVLDTGLYSPSVGVVIPTVNCIEHLVACLKSINSSLNRKNIYVQIVFNGSSNETIEKFNEAFINNSIPNLLNPIILPENIGYGKACNLGCVSLPYVNHVVFLNDDVILPQLALDYLVEPFYLFEKVGIVGVLSNNIAVGQRTHIQSTTLSDYLREAEIWGTNNQPFFRETMVVGPCLAFSSDVLSEVGLFNEDFGLGNFEDTELATRVIKAGFRSILAERLLVYHTGQSTFTAEKIDYQKQYKAGEDLYKLFLANTSTDSYIHNARNNPVRFNYHNIMENAVIEVDSVNAVIELHNEANDIALRRVT